MSYATRVVELFPQELQLPMLHMAEALEQDLRNQLAVRREDFDRLSGVVTDLAQAQQRTEQRVEELAEAQKRTEERVEELAQAQQRTEQRVEELAEAQKRTEERVGRLEVAMVELAEAQKRTEQRVEELAQAQKRTEQRVEELAQAQKRTEQRVEELAQAQKRTEQNLAELTAAVRELVAWQKTAQDRLSTLIGYFLERRYHERAYAYFGSVLRNVQVVAFQDLEATLEQKLSEAEIDDLVQLDVLIRGKLRHHADTPELWLAMEVSRLVDRNDVKRALRRAELLRKAGLRVMPAAAGEDTTTESEEFARDESILLVKDGQRLFWDEALATALAQ